MQWFRNMVRPEKERLLKLLIEQGNHAILIVEALEEYLRRAGRNPRKNAKQVERDADEIQRILVYELNDIRDAAGSGRHPRFIQSTG